MSNRRLYSIVALASAAAAVTLGLLDRETESVASLFTSGGNWAGLVLWTLIFFGVGSLVVAMTRRPGAQ